MDENRPNNADFPLDANDLQQPTDDENRGWDERAREIIDEKHAKSASQGMNPGLDVDSQNGAANTSGPKSQTEPDNTEYEHENQARWREIRM